MLTNVFTKTTRDRWKGEAIGAITLAALFVFAMAVYRDIDLSFYASMPEVWRTLVSIPEDADLASLSYGAVFGSYGALTMAGLAIAMGASSLAGEERKGTMGLLLDNPKSRTSVLVSKTASMVFLTALGTLFLWGTGLVAPEILNVNITGMHVGALSFHMFMISIFFGFLAIAIGAWTGSPASAAGVAAGVLFISFIGAGLFPVIEGLENVAKAFPWYYFNASQPAINGIDWGDIAVLSIGAVVFAVVALIGFNRRDLRDQSASVTLVDRLRSNPMTAKVTDRLAGSARVSHIWTKTASEHQGLVFVTAAIMFLMMGVMMGPMFALLDNAVTGLAEMIEDFPEVLLALFGGGDMSTPEGFYQLETFGMMAPISVMVVTVAVGAGALAGEEERRTMGLLLANPISRTTVVLQKTIAMVLYGIVVGVSIFAGVAIGSLLGRLGMSIANIAATSLLVTLVGLAFGALALALGGATGRAKVAVYGTVGIALVLYVLNAFLPFNDTFAGYAKWSPFYYYLTSDPLFNGMNWAHGAVLTGLTVAFVAVAILLFNRRDLRQTG